MNTPIGRYRWLKFPFGIKSAPEMYQRAMNEMLEGIDHASAIMDDLLVAGRDISHHDSVLEKVLYRAKNYRKKKLKTVGAVRGSHHIRRRAKTSPEKVLAMKDIPPPTTKEDVRRFLGSMQYTWPSSYLC